MSRWVPSTTTLSIAVTVIVCGVFQFVFVNVIVDVENVVLEPEEDNVIATTLVGSESN